MKGQLFRLLAVLLLYAAVGDWRRTLYQPLWPNRIARADSAYRSLPISLSAYNALFLKFVKTLETIHAV